MRDIWFHFYSALCRPMKRSELASAIRNPNLECRTRQVVQRRSRRTDSTSFNERSSNCMCLVVLASLKQQPHSLKHVVTKARFFRLEFPQDLSSEYDIGLSARRQYQSRNHVAAGWASKRRRWLNDKWLKL